MSEFDMEIQHVPGYTNVVPDSLSQCADLVTSFIVDSDLLPRICSLQEATMGELWLQLKQFADHRECGFCI